MNLVIYGIPLRIQLIKSQPVGLDHMQISRNYNCSHTPESIAPEAESSTTQALRHETNIININNNLMTANSAVRNK